MDVGLSDFPADSKAHRLTWPIGGRFCIDHTISGEGSFITSDEVIDWPTKTLPREHLRDGRDGLDTRTMDAAIKVNGLGRRFGPHWAVARLNLTVQADERLLIIGPNGCGKTTLLGLLSTLLPASQGSIEYPLIEGDPRRDIGFMGHDIGIYEDLSAEENMRVFARLGGFATMPIMDLLKTVGLDQRPQPVSSYSAGMRRRLALALLLQQRPKIALLDEPFAQMDPGGIAQVSSAIADLPGTVIIASHQVTHAAPLASRAILMDAGQIRWTGRADEAEAAWRALHRERGEL